MLGHGQGFFHRNHYYLDNFQAAAAQDLYRPLTDPYAFEFAYPSIANTSISNTSLNLGTTPTSTPTTNPVYQFSF